MRDESRWGKAGQGVQVERRGIVQSEGAILRDESCWGKAGEGEVEGHFVSRLAQWFSAHARSVRRCGGM